ncbi:MAG TPA: hypothetical protein VLV83_08180 [Acidobacteriota bacterium]|nr:hypothetical protein [Acidobacteriota bacterium]
MAAVSLETTELETLVEAAIKQRGDAAMSLLNALRVKNGKAAHPANFGTAQLNNIHNAAYTAALAGFQADLDA